MIELKIHIDIKRIPENKNPNKIIKIVEKFLNFDKTQKAKRHSLEQATHPATRRRSDVVTTSLCTSQ